MYFHKRKHLRCCLLQLYSRMAILDKIKLWIVNNIWPWVTLIAAALFFTKGDKPIKSSVRGIRNNNPGNLRKTGLTWQGKVVPGTDPAFEQFKTMAFGIRAMLIDIIGKHRRGLDTIQELINVWAPPVENDTSGYINSVSSRTGISKNVIFSPRKDNFIKIAKAMAGVENGPDALLIPEKDWNEGWRLATSRADIKSYIK
jgi:hypothetical protein